MSATTASGNDSAGSPATYNLAFVISDGNGCTPEWDGMYALDDEEVRSRTARLQKERPGLEVTFTLPVPPSGLDSHGLALLESADRYDVQVSTVNLLTMNYAESYTGDMGDYAIAAAEAAHTRLKKVFELSDAAAWQRMALTSVIGVNDVAGETFTLSEAAQVRAFAERKRIARVSMWSAFRDQQCEKGSSSRGDAAANRSGVTPQPGARGKAFVG